MFSSQFSHLASTNEKSYSPLQVLENLLGELYCRITDGDSAAANSGLCPHPFSHRKRFVQKSVEDYPRCFCLRSLAVSVLDLAEYLRFAHHH